MQKRILVVDDEATIIDLIYSLLPEEEFELSSASNGGEGLRRLETFVPDLIITDISMPDMEGVEFMSRLRKRGIGIPIIAMSGNAVGMSFLKASRLIGAAETLLKPFSGDDLRSAVRRSLHLQ